MNYVAMHLVANIDAALPRTTASEILSINHDVSRLSPVAADTCLPSFLRNRVVDGPSTPVVSMATGSKWYLSARLR